MTQNSINCICSFQELVRQTIDKWCNEDEVAAGKALKLLMFRISADVLCGFHYKDDEDSRKLCEEFETISAGVVSIPFNLPFTAFGKVSLIQNYALNFCSSMDALITRSLFDHLRREWWSSRGNHNATANAAQL